MDLVVTVRTNNSALDEPLRWMLRDPRRLRVTRQSDFLWLRLLDVPAALTARCYMAQDTLTLRVDDPSCRRWPAATRWRPARTARTARRPRGRLICAWTWPTWGAPTWVARDVAPWPTPAA